MFVKICGLTNREDALAAVEFGAGAIGFVFAPSARRADPAKIAPWIHEVPADIWKVGVFVDETPARMEEIARELKLDIAQLHGHETPEQHPKNIRVWKAFRYTGQPIPDYPAAEAIMIDGAGYDWSQTSHLTRPLILAGGLNPGNVIEAIHRAKPWAVDVASGIEAAPGRKDHALMKQFIEATLRS